MGHSWGLSRRTLLRSWVVSLLGKTSAGSTGAGIDPVSFSLRGLAPAIAFERRYRMDATILLLGAPVFTRAAAGGAYASVEKTGEARGEPGSRAIALQFAAGSSPARAHGLNRFGILREAVIEHANGTELSFAGLMTRTREESFEQGRKALASASSGAECVVARGKTSGPAIETWIDTVTVAPDCTWTNLGGILGEALRHEPRTTPRETASSSATTFLHAMRNAALCRESVVRRQFVHAGKPYWLETRRNPERPSELAGAIHDLSGARRAEFRTAYADGDESGIPMRLEYRPRSFLRLTFEAELGATQPPIPSLFEEAIFREESA
jgi:hypothetical protein